MASYKGNIKVMTVLLDGKANPNTLSEDVGTALVGAIASGSQEAVKLLLERGASLTTNDPEK